MDKKKCVDTLDVLIQAKTEMLRDGTAAELDCEDGLKERISALKFAKSAVERPQDMRCGSCEFMNDEDTAGDGWCYKKDSATRCDTSACKSFDFRVR